MLTSTFLTLVALATADTTVPADPATENGCHADMGPSAPLLSKARALH